MISKQQLKGYGMSLKGHHAEIQYPNLVLDDSTGEWFRTVVGAMEGHPLQHFFERFMPGTLEEHDKKVTGE